MEKITGAIIGAVIFGLLLALNEVRLVLNNTQPWWYALVSILCLIVFGDYCYKFGKYKERKESKTT